MKRESIGLKARQRGLPTQLIGVRQSEGKKHAATFKSVPAKATVYNSGPLADSVGTQ
jgi:hypothetical protein